MAMTLATVAAHRLSGADNTATGAAASAPAPAVTYGQVITGVSPLESKLVGVHPRLHLTSARVAEIKQQVGREPWRGLFEKVRQTADAAVESARKDGGGPVESLPSLGLAWLIDGRGDRVETAQQILTQLLRAPEWQRDPRQGGAFLERTLYSMALAYDWLYHGLDSKLRNDVRDLLYRAGRRQLESVVLQENYFAGALAHNLCASSMADITTAGMAIYSDVDEVGPWLKIIIDRARAMTASLGPDGVSAEGICYGGYYADRMIRSLDLIKALLGVDLFESTPWLRNLPLFYAYSMLPRQHWKPGNCHFCFGDGVRYTWFGPSYFMRRLAGIYRDPLAQWLAIETERAGDSSIDAPFLNLLWHDDTVAPAGPARLPKSRHFEDKGLIMMRSGWDGNEAVLGFKCGPHSGHHALQHYPSDIGGGHMHPDAGSFLLFAQGDWLASDGGYSYKRTEYRNTLLIDGHGQSGEGGEWFESIELRRERRGPSMLSFTPGDLFDQFSADLAPAYDAELKLQRLRRHVLYLRPSCWVIVDEIKTQAPSTFESFFHADAGQPFKLKSPGIWQSSGTSGALTVTALSPTDIQGEVSQQSIQGVGKIFDKKMELLQLRPPRKRNRALMITVLEAHPASQSPVLPVLETRRGEISVKLKSGTKTLTFRLRQEHGSILTPAFEHRG